MLKNIFLCVSLVSYSFSIHNITIIKDNNKNCLKKNTPLCLALTTFDWENNSHLKLEIWNWKGLKHFCGRFVVFLNSFLMRSISVSCVLSVLFQFYFRLLPPALLCRRLQYSTVQYSICVCVLSSPPPIFNHKFWFSEYCFICSPSFFYSLFCSFVLLLWFWFLSYF